MLNVSELTLVQCIIVILHGMTIFSVAMLVIAVVVAIEEYFRGDLEYNTEKQNRLKFWAFVALFFVCLELGLWLIS